jgi:ketosteroid isomerase-like protein
MKTNLLSCLVVIGLAAPAFAEDKAPAAAAGAPDMTKFGPMVHQPKNEKADKKELDEFFKAWQAAGQKGDVTALADMMAFPALMQSSGTKGFDQMPMTKEQWVGMMTPMMEHMKDMPKDTKMSMKATCVMMDDDLASCEGEHSMTSAKMKGKFNAQTIMVRVDGKWKVKSMLEAGWGDMPQSAQGTGGSGPAAQPAPTPAAAPAPAPKK